MIELITERLILRQFRPDDAEELFQLNLDPDVLKYTGDKPFENIEAAAKFLEGYNHYQKYGYGRWAVIEISTGNFLGWCGLKFSPNKQETDIGFRFHKKYWNKGFATEAAKASIKAGFEKYQLNKIVGRAMTENMASVKVLEKCGLVFEREFQFDNQPGLIYSISHTK